MMYQVCSFGSLDSEHKRIVVSLLPWPWPWPLLLLLVPLPSRAVLFATEMRLTMGRLLEHVLRPELLTGVE